MRVNVYVEEMTDRIEIIGKEIDGRAGKRAAGRLLDGVQHDGFPEVCNELPDFEALRAERNRRVIEHHQKIADEHGVSLQSLRSTFNPNACYCACSSNGPCEHKWNGKQIYFADGCGSSSTCSRCGCTAMSHDMRVMP